MITYNKKWFRIDIYIYKKFMVAFAFSISENIKIEFALYRVKIYIRIGRWI